MPDIDKINGLTLCDETNVNGIIITDITNIDSITKDCDICTLIQLSESTTGCENACGERCSDHWISKDLTIAPLGVGDYIYRNDVCVCENVFGYIYYADACGARGGTCYIINSTTCQIESTSEC